MPRSVVAIARSFLQHHIPTLLEPIEAGRLHPGVIISHRLPLQLSQAVDHGYRIFDRNREDCRKVVLLPD